MWKFCSTSENFILLILTEEPCHKLQDNRTPLWKFCSTSNDFMLVILAEEIYLNSGQQNTLYGSLYREFFHKKSVRNFRITERHLTGMILSICPSHLTAL
jgi:hypothetical protein